MIQYSIGSAIVPSLLLMWYFHTRDVHREPAKVVWITFALGFAATVPIVLIGMGLQRYVFDPKSLADPRLIGLAEGFLFAAIPEEIFKFLVLFFFASRHKAFDEPMDGIVYGVAASLGFATLENIMYTIQGSLSTAIMRAFTAVPTHAFLGALMGYFVGQARFNKSKFKLWQYFLALFWPILLHGLYDYPLLTVANAKAMTWAIGGWLPLSFATLIIGVIWAYKISKRLSTDQKRALPQAEVIPDGVPVAGSNAATVKAPAPFIPKAGTKTDKRADEPIQKQSTAQTGKKHTWLLLVGSGILCSLSATMMVWVVEKALVTPFSVEALLNLGFLGVVVGLMHFAAGITFFVLGLRRVARNRK